MEQEPYWLENVEEVLEILTNHAKRDKINIPTQPWEKRREEEIDSLKVTVLSVEPLVKDLWGCNKEALMYISGLCRARDGLISRRISTAIGTSRSNGLIGVFFSALTLITFFNAIKSWFPSTSSLLLLFAFVITFWMVLYSMVGLLSGGHSTSRLIYYADVIDNLLKIKGEIEKIEAVALQDVRAQA